MFQLPLLISLSIAATRLYRSLAEYVSGTTEMYEPFFFVFSPGPFRFSIQENNTNLRPAWAPAVPARSHQIDITVHTDYEEDVTSPMSHHSSHIDIDSQPSDQQAESRKELESGKEV